MILQTVKAQSRAGNFCNASLVVHCCRRNSVSVNYVKNKCTTSIYILKHGNFCGNLLGIWQCLDKCRIYAQLHPCASISLHGWGDTVVSPQPWRDRRPVEWPINPQYCLRLIHLHSPPAGTVYGLTAGVEQSHKLNLNLRFTLIRLQGPNDSLH